MSTKRATTKRGATRRPSVKERARAIINDAKAYDDETRHAVKNSLAGDGSDLA